MVTEFSKTRILRINIDYWLLIAFTVLGTALRIYHLGDKSLWLDEATVFHVVQGSWREILAMNVAINSSGPLYPLLLGWVTTPNASEAMLRLPSMIAGVVSIPLGYLLARQFTKSRFALLTPLLISLAPTQILYSQEVREYSLSFCLAIAVILCFSRFLDKQTTGRTWALGLTISVAMAVQHGLILLVAALNLVFFFELTRSKRPFKTFNLWLIAQLPGLATVIAVYVTTISGQLVSGDLVKFGYLADRYWDRTAHGLFTLLMGDGSGIIGFAYPGPIMVILFLLGLVCISTNGTRRAAGFLIAPVAITLALALLGLYPFGGIRQDIFMLPMIYVCASIGLAVVSTWLFKNVNHGGKRIIELLLLTALVLPGLRATYVYLQGAGPQPMRPLVNELRENIQADDRIYVHFSAMPAFQYYWPDKSEPWLKGTEHMVGLGRPERAEKQQLAVTRELALLVEDSGTLWIVLSHLPEEELDSIIPRVEPPRVVEKVAGMNGSWLYRIGEQTGSIL